VNEPANDVNDAIDDGRVDMLEKLSDSETPSPMPCFLRSLAAWSNAEVVRLVKLVECRGLLRRTRLAVWLNIEAWEDEEAATTGDSQLVKSEAALHAKLSRSYSSSSKLSIFFFNPLVGRLALTHDVSRREVAREPVVDIDQVPDFKRPRAFSLRLSHALVCRLALMHNIGIGREVAGGLVDFDQVPALEKRGRGCVNIQPGIFEQCRAADVACGE